MPISSISPLVVTTGTHVTVTGYELSPSPVVHINGNLYPTIISATDTQVVFNIDHGFSPDSTVQVTNAYSVTSESSQTLHYHNPLWISDFSPRPVAVGGTLTVNGTGFNAPVNSPGVSINGVVASYGLVTATQILVTVPAGATTGPLVITNDLGTATGPYDVVVIAPPVITSMSTHSGAPGSSVTLAGTGFDTTPGGSVVRLGGVAATIVSITPTQIVFSVPGGVSGGPVTVTTSGGAATAPGGDFTVIHSPVISSFSPVSGPVGTSVIITGLYFDPTPGNNTVRFSGTVASVTAASSTQLTVTVPTGAITGTISVATTLGTGTSTGVFSVTPAIVSLSVSSGPVGSSLTITGSGYDPATGATVVRVNGTLANITAISSTSVSIQIPVGATTGNVTVTTAGGVATSGSVFTVTNSLPTISGFSPSSGPVGTSVVVSGTNFDLTPGNNTLLFNGVAATVTASTSTTLTTTVPVGAATGPLFLTNPNGVTVSSQSFAVTISPTNIVPQSSVLNFTPSSGPVGTRVTIVGAGFSSTPGNDVVTFNGVIAGVSAASANQMSVTVPAGATTGVVSVTSGGVTQVSSQVFTVTAVATPIPLPLDTFAGAEDDGVLTPGDLISYLRALLKDTDKDITQLGLTSPTWGDPDLYRYLELARGEYTRQRPKRAHVVVQTVAKQQFYAAPVGSLAIDDVLWDPSGYDLDSIGALAASLSGGGAVLWGGGVPVVGRVYFDSPASVQIWSIVREAWRRTFGGKWLLDVNGYNLIPTPSENGNNVLVFYRSEQHWSDIPWQHRMFILTNAVLYAIEALTYQIVAQSPAQGQKLNLGLRALTQMVQQKYGQSLGVREPGVTVGRS